MKALRDPNQSGPLSRQYDRARSRATWIGPRARSSAAEGYGDRFLHRTRHGLGIDIHEAPYITSTSESVLQTGNVFSIEPGIYLEGRFGVRLEDIVVVRDDGPEILSGLSRAVAN